jgi:hypothetical protein
LLCSEELVFATKTFHGFITIGKVDVVNPLLDSKQILGCGLPAGPEQDCLELCSCLANRCFGLWSLFGSTVAARGVSGAGRRLALSTNGRAAAASWLQG